MSDRMVKVCVWWERAKQVVKSEKGQGMVEYALVLAFVAAIATAVFTTDAAGLGKAIEGAFGKVKDALAIN